MPLDQPDWHLFPYQPIMAGAMVVTFLYILSGGMLAVLATGDVRTIAWKYLRTAGAMALALCAGATIWALRDRGWRLDVSIETLGVVPVVGAAILVFVAALLERSPSLYRLLTGLSGAAGIAAGCVHDLRLIDPPPESAGVKVMVAAGFVLSALLLGSINVAWLLGHAYLTQTKMTIAPLRHFSRVVLLAVGLRFIFVTVSLILGLTGAGRVVSGEFPARLAGSWLMLSLRIGVGLVLVGVFAMMVWQCVRLRSTQSATGILYFTMLLVCIGELASQQLLRELGWPL